MSVDTVTTVLTVTREEVKGRKTIRLTDGRQVIGGYRWIYEDQHGSTTERCGLWTGTAAATRDMIDHLQSEGLSYLDVRAHKVTRVSFEVVE